MPGRGEELFPLLLPLINHCGQLPARTVLPAQAEYNLTTAPVANQLLQWKPAGLIRPALHRQKTDQTSGLNFMLPAQQQPSR